MADQKSQGQLSKEDDENKNILDKQFPAGFFLVNASAFKASKPVARKSLKGSGGAVKQTKSDATSQLKKSGVVAQLVPTISVSPGFVGDRSTIATCTSLLQHHYNATNDVLVITNGIHNGFESRQVYVSNPYTGLMTLQNVMLQVEYFDFIVNGGGKQHFYTGNVWPA